MRAPARIALALAIAAGALVATLAMPVERWRTGELPAPELPLVERGPPASIAERLWVDSDAACGAGARVDADDCFALIVLARSGRRIEGVSAVRGNADLATVNATLDRLRGALASEGTSLPSVSASAPRRRDGDSAAGSHPALRDALRAGRLSIVALGPLTNVAAMLAEHPQLVRNMAGVIAVAGRRKGHLFHPSEGRGQGMLLGHGPVFRDFNVASDPDAMRTLLASGVPITLIPYEAARDVVLDEPFLRRLAPGAGAAGWAARQASDWLEFWKRDVGIDGFYPFDALAALYVVEPWQFDCARVRAWMESPPWPLAWLGFDAALYVGLDSEVPRHAGPVAEVVYCPRARPAADERLDAWLAGGEPRT